MTAKEKREATEKAGFREKYAMQHGTEKKKTENGEKLYVFTFSENEKFQDANGATYNATRRAWIG